ncbi:MAG: DUF167 domain-containing protein [Rhodocyclaceae bacterium]|nr:DUF167 domain-containing protein [Rhodocyclaceae bacterium]
MTPPWLPTEETDVLLTLHVQPGAKKTEIAGVYGDALKIRLAAQPVDGKANGALIEYLSDVLETPSARFILAKGETSRRKVVRIRDMSAQHLLSKLMV